MAAAELTAGLLLGVLLALVAWDSRAAARNRIFKLREGDVLTQPSRRRPRALL